MAEEKKNARVELVIDEEREAYAAEERAYNDKMDQLARESGFFVDCDEEVFPLNDDGSAKQDKGEKSDDIKVF